MTFLELLMDIIMPFLGGVGMFLYGMKLMSDNLEKVASQKLRKMLNMITKNRLMGMGVGALFTMAIQSSSATTVMVVGFVNAGLMNLMQAASVIIGANIGTTITSQLIAFKLTAVAPLFLFVGVIMTFTIKNQQSKHAGSAIIGFGLLFLGMTFMADAMKPLRDLENFTNIISQFDNPFLGVMAGAVLTGVIQSSSASMGILQAMSMEGLIELKGAIYIILGFNIGTCITAMLACIGANRTARRAAVIHLLFNLIGSLIFIGLVQILPIVEWIESMSKNPTRNIANFHTLFNISMTLLLLPFAGTLVWASRKIIRGEDPPKEPMKLMYIEEHMFATPIIVISQLGKEVNRMAALARDNIKDALDAFMTGSEIKIKTVYEREEVIDFLNHELTDALVKVNHENLSTADSDYVSKLFHIVSDLERVGDHAENIAEFAETKISKKMVYSEAAIKELEEFSDKVLQVYDLALTAFRNNDEFLATTQVQELEDKIDKMENKLRQRHIKRLKKRECNARAGTIFIDILSNLERVADHATNIANSVIEEK